MRAVKNKAFSVFKVNFYGQKPLKSCLKKFSLMNLKLEEQLLVKWLLILIILIKVYLVKMGPIFDGSHTSCVTRYQKILSVCSLRSKNVLNSTWFPMIFHNRHHTNGDYKTVKIAYFLPKNHQTLHGYFQKMRLLIKVLAGKDHLES